jgi:hypothetical protein
VLQSLCGFSQAALKNISVDEVLEEIFKTENNLDSLKMVVWFPTEFWYLANKDTPDFDTIAVQIIEDLAKDYVIIGALDGILSTEGSLYKNETQLKKVIQLIDQNEKAYFPLSEMQVPKSLTNIIGSMKPMFTNMIGEMGAGLNFYFFNVKDGNEMKLISATREGKFTIKLDSVLFSYNLPLTAFLPQKFRPHDQSKMKPQWIYCPFHGNKLSN